MMKQRLMFLLYAIFECYAKFQLIFICCAINLCKLQSYISNSTLRTPQTRRVKYRKHFYRLTDLHDRLKKQRAG